MKITSLIVTALATSVVSTAYAHEFDVSPIVGPDNKIHTNAYTDEDGDLVENVRVFGFVFGEIDGQPYFLPDPGFHPLPGSGFAAGTAIGFQIIEPLRYWSGIGSPAFVNAPADESIRFAYGTDSVVSTGASIPSASGFSFVVVDANGEADDHLETTLEAATDPATGVYLATVQITAVGYEHSDPMYWLFSNGIEEDRLTSAVLFTRDTFAPGSTVVVPEPTALLGLFLLPLGMRRRRLVMLSEGCASLR